jgi:hypothetical protein
MVQNAAEFVKGKLAALAVRGPRFRRPHYFLAKPPHNVYY